MTLVMCFIENGSHRSLLIFLSVIHSSRDSPSPQPSRFGAIPRGARALLNVSCMVVCANVSAAMHSGGDSKGDDVEPAVYCLAAVDGSVMVIKIAVWMARLLRFEGPNL